MAEYDVREAGLSLTIDTKYYNKLDIEGFLHMMKDPSYCYKFYWLEAIVQLISEGVTETTFGPESYCTRAQLCTFLHRFSNYINN